MGTTTPVVIVITVADSFCHCDSPPAFDGAQLLRAQLCNNAAEDLPTSAAAAKPGAKRPFMIIGRESYSAYVRLSPRAGAAAPPGCASPG